MPSADCVIALSFGYQIRNGERLPGLSNHALATVVHDDYSELPKVLQFEIADAFALLDDEPVMRVEPGDQYLDTHGVLDRAAAVCRKAQWSSVALVAHPVHLSRVVSVAEKVGLVTIPSQLERMSSIAVPYDPASEQSWTRSERAAKAHEFGAKLFYKAVNQS